MARFILQGTGLVTASLDRTLKRWDLGFLDITRLRTLEGHKVSTSQHCALHPNVE